MKLYVVNRLYNDGSIDMTPTCEGIFTTEDRAKEMVRGLTIKDATKDETKDEYTTMWSEEYISIRFITLETATITYTIEEVNV